MPGAFFETTSPPSPDPFLHGRKGSSFPQINKQDFSLWHAYKKQHTFPSSRGGGARGGGETGYKSFLHHFNSPSRLSHNLRKRLITHRLLLCGHGLRLQAFPHDHGITPDFDNV
ncbi:MAG: hypothetical protein Greene041662_33 [Candidatus Peregrinibacteria bacterium Greene0416_62]|nr:MAG: hypothetical protein Greene041662_33 [Candidatus Peregrinibacteria bacterium Greene0416_62]